jgi:hypothetical protein
MKKMIILLLAAVLMTATRASATDAALLMSALNANPATNRIVEHQRLQPFLGNLVSNWSGSSGLVVISNVDVGDYNVWIRQRGQSGQIAFSFSITTNDSGTVWVHTNNLSVINVGTYPKTGQAAWSIAAAESRYAPKGEAGGGAVTGAELVETSTNGTLVTTLVRTQAIQQLTVAGSTNAANATNLYPSGPLSVNFNSGTLTAGNFIGSGAGLTDTPADKGSDNLPLRYASLKTLIGLGPHTGSKYVAGTNFTGAGQSYSWSAATANIGDLVITNDFRLTDATLTNSASYAQDNSSIRISNNFSGKLVAFDRVNAFNAYRGIYLKPNTDFFYNFSIRNSSIVAPFTAVEMWYGYGDINNCLIVATNSGSELGAAVCITANDDSQVEVSSSRLLYGQSDFSGGLLAYARAKVKFRNVVFESKDYPTNTSAIYLAEGHTAHPTSVTVEDSMFIHKGAPVVCVSPYALSEDDSYRVDFKNVILNPATNGVVIWNTNFIVRVWGGNLVPGNFANRSNVIWDGYWGEFKTNAIALGIAYTNSIAPTINGLSYLAYGGSAADYIQLDLLVDFDGNNTWDLSDPRIMTDVSTTTFIPVLNASWTWPLNVGSRWMISTNNTLLDGDSTLGTQFGAFWRVAK